MCDMCGPSMAINSLENILKSVNCFHIYTPRVVQQMRTINGEWYFSRLDEYVRLRTWNVCLRYDEIHTCAVLVSNLPCVDVRNRSFGVLDEIFDVKDTVAVATTSDS